jgi:flagellar hook-associated protein 1 FlgK
VGASATSGVGDGTRAQAILQLSNLQLDIQDMPADAGRTYFADDASPTATAPALVADSNGIPTISSSTNGMTVGEYYTNDITAMGTDASQANTNLTNSASVLNSFTLARTSESGVSTDDEMTNLIQYDHAYEANAKVISTVSDLLDAVIAMVAN